ncbi:MAG: hypothetical protein GY716_22515 [bacterium]|nr:hypothetical protein [bacterium]
MNDLDRAWETTRAGSHHGFSAWVKLCELPLRRSLRSFARVVDTESVLQEGLLRMWRLAPTKELEGENASLRMALRLVRNLAISETRRFGREVPEQLEDAEVHLEPGRLDAEPSDPVLRKAIAFCVQKLPDKPRTALLARLGGGDDRDLAAGLDMRRNTFLQNIVRARKLLRKCLEGRGVRVEELST